jgi:thiol-disulfide isomerase/thioredoxin
MGYGPFAGPKNTLKTPSFRSVAALFSLALPLVHSGSVTAGGVPVAGPAPSLNVTSLAGNPFGLADLKGKVMVVDFWATWCGPCVREIPGYIALQKRYGERGLVVVGLSVDSKGATTLEAFAKARGVNYPLALATPEIIDAFGRIQGLATTLLIDREGTSDTRKSAQWTPVITGNSSCRCYNPPATATG